MPASSLDREGAGECPVILAARAYDRAKERNGLSRASPCTCNSRDNERRRDIAKELLLLSLSPSRG